MFGYEIDRPLTSVDITETLGLETLSQLGTCWFVMIFCIQDAYFSTERSEYNN